MSPGGGVSVAAEVALTVALAAALAEVVEAGGAAGVLPEPPLLQAAAQSPTAARMTGRLITPTALTMSMAGRYKEPGKGRRCAR